MFQCQHDYCPHLHFNKCLNARLRSIPYTIFPDGTIDSFTNVPIRCAKLYKSNIPTVAYQNYTLAEGATDDDRNFVKNYYLDKTKQVETLVNNIVEQQKEDITTRSAYVLAESANQQFAQYARKKQSVLQNAKRRAVSRYNQHFREINQKKQQQNQENAKWLKKLYRKLDEVARHIIEGQGQSIGDREKQFLLTKSNLNAAYLSQIKVRNPKVAYQMLEELRTLMLKKKLRFQELRQEQEHNKSATMSFASQSGISGGNTTQGSMMSQATLNESNIFGEDQVISKFCDFEKLKKKWKVEDIQEVKEILRRVLTRQIVSDAQLQAVKKRRQAEKNNEKIRKTLDNKEPQRAKTGRKPSKKSKNQQIPLKKQPPTIINRINLTKDEAITKETLLKGGQFDAIGQKFERNRNFSQMFKKREQNNTVEFVYKDRVLELSKDCCCSTQA